MTEYEQRLNRGAVAHQQPGKEERCLCASGRCFRGDVCPILAAGTVHTTLYKPLQGGLAACLQKAEHTQEPIPT